MKRLSLLLMITLSPGALGWGPAGHRIVCYIAWQALPVSLKEQVNLAANRVGYRAFVESCLWADHIRSSPRFYSLKTLHYVNVPKSADNVNRHRDCPNKGKPSCVLTAISYYQQRWRNAGLNQQQQDQALLLLAHFVGDIHQPMHVSYQFDRGGNRHKMQWMANKTPSLHSLWDNTIIDCHNKINWRKLAHQLYITISPKQRQQWQVIDSARKLSIDQWANESLALTREIYAYLDKPWKPLDYCRHFTPMAQQRLQMAGIRLAALLHD